MFIFFFNVFYRENVHFKRLVQLKDNRVRDPFWK